MKKIKDKYTTSTSPADKPAKSTVVPDFETFEAFETWMKLIILDFDNSMKLIKTDKGVK